MDRPTREQLAAAMKRIKENPETDEQAAKRIIDALIDDTKYIAEMRRQGKKVPFE